MNNTIKGILIGVVSSLIATGIVYAITIVWNISVPVWTWLCITIGVVFLLCFIRHLIVRRRINHIISEYTEGAFGNSYVYTWKYKKSRKGFYSAYGYEATEIHKKAYESNENSEILTIRQRQEVPEETIKLYVQLMIIANVNKRMGMWIQPMMNLITCSCLM